MSAPVRYQGLMLLAGSFFVFAWLMPTHNPPWTTAYQDFASFFAGILFLLVMLLSRLTKVTPAIFGFFLLASIPPLQGWLGLMFIPGDAWIISVFLLGFALMLMVGYNLSLSLEGRYFFARLLAAILVIGALLSLWVALRQWLRFPSGDIWVIDLPFGGRPYANFAQPNSLATLLCMGLAGVLYFFERYFLGRFSAGLLAVLLLFGVALTQSRTPWVLSGAVLIFWSWKAYGGQLRLSTTALLGWLSIYVVYLLMLPLIADALLIAESGPLSERGASGRLAMWWQLWHAVLQGPIWGYGWGQVSVAQISVAAAYPAPRLTTLYSHNILLDLLIWNGPVLGGLIILCIGLWLWRICCKARSLESLFALLAASCVLVHALLEYPLAYAFFLLPLGLLLGLAATEVRSKREFDMPRWLLGFILLCSMGMYGWFFKEYRIFDEYYRVSRLEEARIKGAVAGAVPEVSLIRVPYEYVNFIRLQPFEGMSSAQLDWMRKVAHRRTGAFALFRYTLALGLNGRQVEANQQLKVIRAQHGEHVYLQALQELQNMEVQYPQLAAVRLHTGNTTSRMKNQ